MRTSALHVSLPDWRIIFHREKIASRRVRKYSAFLSHSGHFCFLGIDRGHEHQRRYIDDDTPILVAWTSGSELVWACSGDDGENGQDAVACQAQDNQDGTYTLTCGDTTITVTDGSNTEGPEGPEGPKGVDGTNGTDGTDGQSCSVSPVNPATGAGGGGGAGGAPGSDAHEYEVTCGGASVTVRDGTNSLVDVFTGVNDQCSGTTVSVGTDDNHNGVLDPTEVDETSYVCAEVRSIFEPVADGHTGDAHDVETLKVSPNGNSFVYLRFDLSSLPKNAEITNVRLSAYAWDGYAPGGNGNVYAQLVSDDTWDETTLDTAAPAASGINLAYWWEWFNYSSLGRFTSMTSPELHEAVQGEVAGDGVISLRLHSPGYYTEYRPREWPNADERVKLTLTYRVY